MNLTQRISMIWNNFITVPEMTIAMTVSVIVFTVLYFYLIKFLFDNKAEPLLALFIFVMVIGAGILSFAEQINTAIYLVIPTIFIIAIMILYSVEIKRIILTRKSSAVDVKHKDSYDEDRVKKCVAEIIRLISTE